MKIPKVFWLFLAIAQTVLTLGHYGLYKAIIVLFPNFWQPGSIFWLLMLLSVSFLVLTIITFKKENIIFRWLIIAASVWLPLFFYFLIASVVAEIIITIWPASFFVAPVALFCLAGIFILYGIINARVARVITLKIKLPNLPEVWKNKTAIMVSDLHLGHVLKKGFAQKVINKINSLKPEIVFIPGDFFDGVKTNFDELAELFKSIQVPRGVYYVTGNHEEIAGYKVCENAIAKAGIHILENQKVTLDGLQVAGLAYFTESQETAEVVLGKLQALNLEKSKPSILLKHVPNRAKEIADFGVTLQLSGHTHHGQIWPFRYITHRVYKTFDYGLKKIGQNLIYTSSGVGTWGPPLRIFTKSEIVQIIFE